MLVIVVVMPVILRYVCCTVMILMEVLLPHYIIFLLDLLPLQWDLCQDRHHSNIITM